MEIFNYQKVGAVQRGERIAKLLKYITAARQLQRYLVVVGKNKYTRTSLRAAAEDMISEVTRSKKWKGEEQEAKKMGLKYIRRRPLTKKGSCANKWREKKKIQGEIKLPG